MIDDQDGGPAALSEEGRKGKAASDDIDPATAAGEEEEEARLPEAADDGSEVVGEGRLASGRAAIQRAVQHAPFGAGVYRMLGTEGDVLYVGKAKSVRKRLSSYARPTGQPARIERMIAATVNVEFIRAIDPFEDCTGVFKRLHGFEFVWLVTPFPDALETECRGDIQND